MLHTRDEVIRRTRREFTRLDQLVDGLTPEGWERLVPRPEGKENWTVKDTLAHITHWKQDIIRAMRKQRRPLEEQGLGENEANHQVFMRWHERSPQEVLAWHRQVQEELLQELQSAPENWFNGRERRPEWPYDLDGHSAFHRTRDIERALAKRENP